MPGGDAQALARQVAERVEEALEAAEKRAEEIIARAEDEAGRIRSRAESEARERIERAQDAVDRLVKQADELRDALRRELAAGEPGPEAPVLETPAPEVDPTPATVPEPEPARPAGDRPSTEQLIERLKGGGNAKPDEAGARLVAMNMALDGKPREEVERRLVEDYKLEDAGAILDDVYSRVGE